MLDCWSVSGSYSEACRKSYLGARTQISPRSPVATSVLLSIAMILAWQLAFNSPTEFEIEATVGSQPRREHVASVIPHPCYFELVICVTQREGIVLAFTVRSPSGQRASHSCIISPPRGAAPDPISITLLRSYFFVKGDFANACIFVSMVFKNLLYKYVQ
jgi:hypothetical protein